MWKAQQDCIYLLNYRSSMLLSDYNFSTEQLVKDEEKLLFKNVFSTDDITVFRENIKNIQSQVSALVYERIRDPKLGNQYWYNVKISPIEQKTWVQLKIEGKRMQTVYVTVSANSFNAKDQAMYTDFFESDNWIVVPQTNGVIERIRNIESTDDTMKNQVRARLGEIRIQEGAKTLKKMSEL